MNLAGGCQANCLKKGRCPYCIAPRNKGGSERRMTTLKTAV